MGSHEIMEKEHKMAHEVMGTRPAQFRLHSARQFRDHTSTEFCVRPHLVTEASMEGNRLVKKLPPVTKDAHLEKYGIQIVW